MFAKVIFINRFWLVELTVGSAIQGSQSDLWGSVSTLKQWQPICLTRGLSPQSILGVPVIVGGDSVVLVGCHTMCLTKSPNCHLNTAISGLLPCMSSLLENSLIFSTNTHHP
jgi:hypothetical protein